MDHERGHIFSLNAEITIAVQIEPAYIHSLHYKGCNELPMASTSEILAKCVLSEGYSSII